MGRPLYTNNAATYLAFGITNTATTMQVSANAGNLFPNPTGGDYFYVSLISLSGPIIEIVKCTARNGDIFTIERGQEGTTPLYWNTGDNVQLRITAASLNLFALDNIAANISFTPYSFITATNVQGAIDQTVDTFASSSGSSLVGYNEGNTGAVNRTVQSRLQDFVSVKDFGAAGDGTTNDYTAITNAFATGKSVYFPVGTYLTGSPLNLPQNVVIWGEGNLSVITGSGNMSVIQSIGTSGSHTNGTIVKNLTISRTGGVTGSPLYQPVTLTFADNCKFQNVTFTSTGTYSGSFIAMGCSNLEVTDCYFNAVGCNITSSDGTSAGTWSSNTVLRNCRMAGAGQGFDIYYTTNTLVEGCIASGSTSTYGCGFIVEYQNTGVTFTDCVAYGHVRSGFYYEPEITNGIKDVSFNNCIGYGNGEAGLYLQNAGNVNITGGFYYSNTGTFGSGNGMGMVIYTSGLINISNVNFNNNVGSGLVLYNGYISNISNCVFNSNGAYGINFTNNPPSGVNLLGNTFQGNTSGTVNGWNEFGNYWDLGGWVSYTPTFYKNDGTTTFTPSSLSVKFKRLGSVVHVVGSFNVSSSTLNGTTYVSAPYSVNWTGTNTGNDAQSMLGACRGSSSGVGYVDAVYYTANLAIHGPSTSDTLVAFDAVYEISGQ
jgi:hypothetical protein